MKFEQLVTIINKTSEYFYKKAVTQINISLSIRNWLIGFYIVEFEQKGKDRAAYGEKLIEYLSKELKKYSLKSVDPRSLRECRKFYEYYPQIWGTVSPELELGTIKLPKELLNSINNKKSIWGAASPKLQEQNNEAVFYNTETLSAPEYLPANILLEKLSYSHFLKLLRIDEPLKRLFYEVQAIKNSWSIRELDRAINTLTYERIGLSKNKNGMLKKLQNMDLQAASDVIKDPFILEFLRLEEKYEYTEKVLETTILDHLQTFLIELGNGFCFEARQKRITFSGSHYYIDLVFYHRILKCHVLIDLKIRAFEHADVGQMNFYLNYYKEEQRQEGDNLPIGIILCSDKNETMVQYATGGLNQEIFVSKYLVALPKTEELKKIIHQDRIKLED